MTVSVDPSTYSSSTSSRFLAEIRANDSEGWKTFSKLYCPMVYQWARSAGLQPQDASDIMQNVFQIVFRKIDQYEHKSFRGWLWGITRLLIKDFYRRHQNHIRSLGGSDAQELMNAVPNGDPLSDEESLVDSKKTLLLKILEMVRADFDEETWRVFEMYCLQAKPIESVQQITGKTAGSIRQAKYRILQRVRHELEILENPKNL